MNYTLLGSQRGVDATTQISVGSLAAETVFRSASDVSGPAGFQFTVAAPASAYLTFTSLTGGMQGALLDRVEVGAVPEPASIALLLAAVPVLFALRRRGA